MGWMVQENKLKKIMESIGVDMGLMWAFDVDRRGFPHGCPGLQTFFPSSDRFSDFTCGIDGRPWFVDPSLAFNDPNITRVTRNAWTVRTQGSHSARRRTRNC